MYFCWGGPHFRLLNALTKILEVLGLTATKGAVNAYLDGLVLREHAASREAFVQEVSGRKQYDLLTFELSAASRTTPLLSQQIDNIDFLSINGVKKGTIAQVNALAQAVPLLQAPIRLVKMAGSLVGETLTTMNVWLREPELHEMTLLADIMDNKARGGRQVELHTDEEIEALVRKTNTYIKFSGWLIATALQATVAYKNRLPN